MLARGKWREGASGKESAVGGWERYAKSLAEGEDVVVVLLLRFVTRVKEDQQVR